MRNPAEYNKKGILNNMRNKNQRKMKMASRTLEFSNTSQFPKTLDDAEVLFFTPKDDFGEVYYATGEVADYIKYMAICRYEGVKEEYYLFRCDENYEVVSDSVWGSIDECMEVANSSHGGDILWIKADA